MWPKHHLQYLLNSKSYLTQKKIESTQGIHLNNGYHYQNYKLFKTTKNAAKTLFSFHKGEQRVEQVSWRIIYSVTNITTSHYLLKIKRGKSIINKYKPLYKNTIANCSVGKVSWVFPCFPNIYKPRKSQIVISVQEQTASCHLFLPFNSSSPFLFFFAFVSVFLFCFLCFEVTSTNAWKTKKL